MHPHKGKHAHTHIHTHKQTLVGGHEAFDAFFQAYTHTHKLTHTHMQTLVGGHEAFDAFFQAYLKEHQFKTVTSEGFRAFFMKHFEGNPAVSQVGPLNWSCAGALRKMAVHEQRLNEGPSRLEVSPSHFIGSLPKLCACSAFQR